MITKRVADLKAGDETPWYTVEEDAYVNPETFEVVVRVQHIDGGISRRIWEDPECLIEVLS